MSSVQKAPVREIHRFTLIFVSHVALGTFHSFVGIHYKSWKNFPVIVFFVIFASEPHLGTDRYEVTDVC